MIFENRGLNRKAKVSTVNIEIEDRWPNLKNFSGGLNLSRGLNMVDST